MNEQLKNQAVRIATPDNLSFQIKLAIISSYEKQLTELRYEFAAYNSSSQDCRAVKGAVLKTQSH